MTIVAVMAAVRQAQLREVAERGHELERDIIRAAMMRGGRITALDVKPRHTVPVELIEERLRALHRHGYCESSLTEDGYLTYVFKDFDDTPQRMAAIEKKILMLAETKNGIVTARAVALATDLSYAEARLWLRHMVEERICYPTAEPDTFTFTPPRVPGELETDEALPSFGRTLAAEPEEKAARPPRRLAE